MLGNQYGSDATGLLCAEAGMLGVSHRAVRNLVARGELEARCDGEGAAARILVPVAPVETLRAERHGRG